jgi:hypothetical protein
LSPEITGIAHRCSSDLAQEFLFVSPNRRTQLKFARHNGRNICRNPSLMLRRTCRRRNHIVGQGFGDGTKEIGRRWWLMHVSP